MFDPERAHELGLFHGVDGVADEAVDVVGFEAGVGQGRPNRLTRELQLAASGLLRELGLADPDDRGLPAPRRRGHVRAPSESRKTGTA